MNVIYPSLHPAHQRRRSINQSIIRRSSTTGRNHTRNKRVNNFVNILVFSNKATLLNNFKSTKRMFYCLTVRGKGMFKSFGDLRSLRKMKIKIKNILGL